MLIFMSSLYVCCLSLSLSLSASNSFYSPSIADVSPRWIQHLCWHKGQSPFWRSETTHRYRKSTPQRSQNLVSRSRISHVLTFSLHVQQTSFVHVSTPIPHIIHCVNTLFSSHLDYWTKQHRPSTLHRKARSSLPSTVPQMAVLPSQ